MFPYTSRRVFTIPCALQASSKLNDSCLQPLRRNTSVLCPSPAVCFPVVGLLCSTCLHTSAVNPPRSVFGPFNILRRWEGHLKLQYPLSPRKNRGRVDPAYIFHRWKLSGRKLPDLCFISTEIVSCVTSSVAGRRSFKVFSILELSQIVLWLSAPNFSLVH